MPAKKQVGKKNVVASKSQKKSKPKGKSELPSDEAPLIIKGSAQGPEYSRGKINLEAPFIIKSMYPLDFTFETPSIDMKPCVYTLAGTQAIEKIRIESSNCNCEINSGDFEITIFLKSQ